MQKVILDLLPGGVAPIVYASQYDDGRSIRFMLTEGGPDSQYSLHANDVITCNLTKPDGTETVINVANPGGGEHYVDLVNGADDYDQAGAYLGEIVLTRNARVIGSANFVLKVEEDAYGGQITTLTVTGNPCTFTTDLADALVSLTAEIVCSGGGGTPSTPIPIVGHSELNLDVNGNTFTVAFGQTIYGGLYDANRGKVRITHAGTTLNGSEAIDVTDAGLSTQLFVVPAVGVPTVSAIGYDSTDLLCNAYTACAWSANPWNVNNSISFYVYDGTLRIKDDACADVAAFKAYLANNPVTIVYPLATPIVIDVPSISVFAENGVNNIVSDVGGDVDVTYIKKV